MKEYLDMVRYVLENGQHKVNRTGVATRSVFAGMVYGPGIGMIFGAASLAVNFLFMQRITMFTILVLPAYAGIGFLSTFFSIGHVTAAGILFSVMYNVLVSFIIFALFGGKMWKCAVFSTTNIVWNSMVFTTLAPFLVTVFL